MASRPALRGRPRLKRVIGITEDAPTLPQACPRTASLALHVAKRRESVRSDRAVGEGGMKFDFERDRLETLKAAIGHSPIVVKQRAPRLPAGFDETDVAVLEWIAAEARRARRMHILM